MPELPEVETIARGLETYVLGQQITKVQVHAPRTVRNQPGGAEEFARLLTGEQITSRVRRGKFLWFTVGQRALVIHLGMSGQLHVSGAALTPATAVRPVIAEGAPKVAHVRAEITLGNGSLVSFVDQRIFGKLLADELVPDPWVGVGQVPGSATHIAPDPFDPGFDLDRVAQRYRSSARPIKTLLLDQAILSGIGNIYADEGLFRAGIRGTRPGRSLRRWEVATLVDQVREVMSAAIEAGGTSFDELYVNVRGEPGYFARSLSVYGRAGQACARCGTTLQRLNLGQRSHVYCAHCQGTRPGSAQVWVP